jgi:hypothetical protein
MPLNLFRPLSPAEHDAALLKIARRAMLIEYDRTIIQNARQAIQRSRELLEATEHQVRPPSASK